MAATRDVPGALGGSRILEVPEVAAEVAALRALLAGPGPKLLEIGFDHGRRLTSTAQASPGWTVIGLEVRARRVAELRAWAVERGLPNLHVFRLDARAVLAGALPAASLDVVEALFPTPWPEGKARRRLLVTPEFLGDAARALRPGGLLHLATDVAWYAELVDAALATAAGILPVAPPDALATLRPPCPQQSRREWKCERDGLAVYRALRVRA
ncbi:MAG: tRNA (guanosine(46)-N7)-methyltransferase TrmB [Deltaproteobacteria bacterium HGW-Deltaproteobacteria-14]|jgi:tRNA (guanine-N7-)-methyltransferase|nr:MAG: tRNA (guanosine(46)-N7)-methyltransferase TrmB [Deltaproteobacteria bacterium HGW-Deltaproteobacteria-14]